jgi:hypothetical protein
MLLHNTVHVNVLHLAKDDGENRTGVATLRAGGHDGGKPVRKRTQSFISRPISR